jgi:hypothetical protein
MPDVFSTVQDIDSKVVLDYTSRDFTAIRAQLVGLARGLMPEWETVGEPSDFGTLLLELFAYMGDVMNFYIDRTASEAFLGTAIRRQSVLYIADMLGYTPIGQQAAFVGLEFALDPNAPVDPLLLPAGTGVIVPAGTRIYNNASSSDQLIVFELNTDVKLKPGDTAIPGYATEGLMTYDSLLGVSGGSPNTEFIIPDKGVVYGSLTMKSREGPSVIEWSQISDLSLARPTQSVFTTFVDEAEFTHIVFGDQAAGRIPPVNAEIFVTYRTGVGVEANSLPSASLDTLKPVDSTTNIWGVTVTNPASPVGGTDPESVDAMRNSIPRAATRLKNRAITLNDYADLALQVPGVAKSMAHGTVYTSVHIVIAPTGGLANDAYMVQLAENVERYMADKIIVGSAIQVEPDTVAELWQSVYVQLMVHVQDSYNRTTVRHAVEQALRQMMAFDNVDFGTRISIGTVYRMALSVQGVEWIDLFWLNGTAPVSTGGTATVTNKAATTTVATLTFASHTFANGQQVRVVIGDPAFDGYQTITGVTATTITYARTGTAVTSVASGGTVSAQSINIWADDDQRLISDIDPADWLIPHLSETVVVETAPPWPSSFDTEELTHDGLWVQAQGGLPGS